MVETSSSGKVSVKLPEPKAFYGDNKLARSWLSAIRRYFAAVELDEDEPADTIRMCTLACALMQGNAARWLDRLELSNDMPANF